MGSAIPKESWEPIAVTSSLYYICLIFSICFHFILNFHFIFFLYFSSLLLISIVYHSHLVLLLLWSLIYISLSPSFSFFFHFLFDSSPFVSPFLLIFAFLSNVSYFYLPCSVSFPFSISFSIVSSVFLFPLKFKFTYVLSCSISFTSLFFHSPYHSFPFPFITPSMSSFFPLSLVPLVSLLTLFVCISIRYSHSLSPFYDFLFLFASSLRVSFINHLRSDFIFFRNV